MKTWLRVFLSLGINFFSTQSIAEQIEAPWVRVYSEYVEDVYFDPSYAQADEEHQAENVLVAISKNNLPFNEFAGPQIELRNYFTNKVEHGLGCIVHPDDDSPATDACGQLRLKALKKFPSENRSCKLSAKSTFWTLIFIDHQLADVRCLGRSGNEDRYFKDFFANDWYRGHIDLGTRHVLRSGIEPELVMGQNAYLGLESNRIFECAGYGVPVTYREKTVSRDETLVGNPRHDGSFYRMPPTWQYQYLIKTEGFLYCHQGKRMIDEPTAYGTTLNDGSVLLVGNVSVLRIRGKDGSTKAEIEQVKRVAPSLTRQRLIDFIGSEVLRENPDICNPSISGSCPLNALGAWASNKKFNASRYFIQGIDYVMQSVFNNP